MFHLSSPPFTFSLPIFCFPLGFCLRILGGQALDEVGGGAPCSGIQNRACISSSVCTTAVYLKRPSIIQIPCNGSSDDRHAYDFLSVCAADGKFMPNDRLMMAVMLCHKRICLRERDWANIKHLPFLLPPAFPAIRAIPSGWNCRIGNMDNFSSHSSCSR